MASLFTKKAIPSFILAAVFPKLLFVNLFSVFRMFQRVNWEKYVVLDLILHANIILRQTQKNKNQQYE
jgi:hypothetical protein